MSPSTPTPAFMLLSCTTTHKTEEIEPLAHYPQPTIPEQIQPCPRHSEDPRKFIVLRATQNGSKWHIECFWCDRRGGYLIGDEDDDEGALQRGARLGHLQKQAHIHRHTHAFKTRPKPHQHQLLLGTHSTTIMRDSPFSDHKDADKDTAARMSEGLCVFMVTWISSSVMSATWPRQSVVPRPYSISPENHTNTPFA